jgi:hypothetical protein
MKQLRITKAKPNPMGKDWFPLDIPAAQLGAEWVEFKNIGDESYYLNDVELNHIAYTADGVKWEVVTGFSGTLPVGESVRVHSGAGPLTALRPVDIAGADYHIFSGKGYVWNNDKVDKPALWDLLSRKWIDRTFYDAYPPDGAILLRAGDKLIP